MTVSEALKAAGPAQYAGTDEEVVPMAAPAPFDPLIELYGLWTTELGEKYLPIKGMPPAKYECLDGKLILSPYESAPNVYAADELRTILKPAVRAAGLRLYTTVNLRFNQQRWIQPDFTVTKTRAEGTWVDADDAVLVGEFLSPTSESRDRVDKPALCAKAGIPYFLVGEVSLRHEFVSLHLFGLEGKEYQPITSARAGERFEVDEPFPMSFDPKELLDL